MHLEFPDRLKTLKINRISLLVYATLAAIVIFAIALRLLPTQWGLYLDEFDPFIQFKSASLVVQNGFSAWYSFLDPTRWAPWGTIPADGLGVGVPFTGAVVYFFLDFIGAHASLLDVAVLLPVVMGAVMVVLVYGIGSSLVNRGVGLLAAFVFAVDPTAVQRTGAGWFDTEMGLFGMFLSILFFVKAQKHNTISYSIIAGLGLAYITVTWGAYLYPLNLFAIYAIVMTLVGKWSKNLSVSYMITVSLGLFSLAISPDRGLSNLFSVSSVVPMMAVIVCLAQSFTQYIKDPLKRRKVTLASVTAIIVLLIGLTGAGVFGSLASKFWTILNPFTRITPGAAIVGTVGEQFPAIWYNFFANYHVLIILAPVGAYFAIKRSWSKDVFLVLLALMSIYGASSYVRLMITVAPFMTILAGYALTNILSNIMPIIRQKISEKKGHVNLLSRGYGFLIIALVVIALVPVAYTNAQYADHPAMIVTSSTSYAFNIPDWSNALAWMRDNIPSTATIGCWWDYGYWINVMANKTVIADNSTNNSTQIQQIAFAFLGNENNSLTIFKQMGVNYIVVYEPFEIVTYNNSYVGLPPWSQEGDFEKSTAMMAIAGYNVTDYIKGVTLNSGTSAVSWPLPAGTNAHDCLLYQLLYQPFAQQYSDDFGIHFDQLQHYTLVYASSDYWVLIYKINYS